LEGYNGCASILAEDAAVILEYAQHVRGLVVMVTHGLLLELQTACKQGWKQEKRE